MSHLIKEIDSSVNSEVKQTLEANPVKAGSLSERPDLVAVWLLIEQLAALLVEIGSFDLTLLQTAQALVVESKKEAEKVRESQTQLTGVTKRLDNLKITVNILTAVAGVGGVAELYGTARHAKALQSSGNMLVQGMSIVLKLALAATKGIEAHATYESAELQAAITLRKQDVDFLSSDSSSLIRQMNGHLKIEQEMANVIGRLIRHMHEAQQLERAG